MVDLALLQSVSYIAGALGVCVAAAYYVMILRLNQKTTKFNQTTSIMQSFSSEEGQRNWGELMNMEWRDYDGFEKYGSDNNLDNFAKRQSTFFLFDTLGNLLRIGLADRETLYNATNLAVPWTWKKFESVLLENRRRYSGKDQFTGFEYLADEMIRMKLEREPSYKLPETYLRYVSVDKTQ